ncbi:MAG: ABC transporter ATP-binding protein [Thermomicrobiales bacterium]
MQAAEIADDVIIRTLGLRKVYGNLPAVDGVDLDVQAGEIFGILGPNGAGKTTTLEMIEGLRQPDAGSIVVAGFDGATQGDHIRSIIGVQLQTTALFDFLTAGELIRLFGDLYGTNDATARVDTLLHQVGLQDKRDAQVKEMSGGQQQRLSIALALVNNPVVAFLDEPTTGLDPGARRELWQTVRDIRERGTTVVLTTHYMEEAEILCDRVAIMDRGTIIALNTPRELIRQLDANATISAMVDGAVPQSEALAALPGVVSVTVAEHAIDLGTRDVQRSLVALLDLANRSDIALNDLRTSQPTLEDVFLALTGRTYVPASDENGENEERNHERRRFGRRKR